MPKRTRTIISWNVNGIRSVLRQGLSDFIKKHHPDILCLQETKAEQGQAVVDLPDYEEYWNSAKKRKGYSGTAIFSKQKPLSVSFDLPVKGGVLTDEYGDANGEGRVITADYGDFFLVNVYTPNAKPDLGRLAYRHKVWDPAFLKYLKALEKKKPVIATGDFNVAHEEIDIARPKENVKNAGFTPEERKGFERIVEAGFVDTFRLLHPNEKDRYTWWARWSNARARNVGWRIDYVIVSPALKRKIKRAFILDHVMGSDHCPVGVDLLG
ncbi:exodeoxyribonuclease III [Candidatus Uhrbacteria bacterium]|nr:exodeoxyribonuclease III [Candidatus Uhrbacteria bacterium]